ncbi:hypothetical protein SAMN05216588_104259 [Pseudomonas flavescens]|uniref:LasR-specific antiactivator QslA domain-containing protein n=1 Tax=Phytopseudomonas flavescens TaxID=29435 RepID=A0A1G8C446_9GAMM|nr:LasR-specific antiactivator QslA [Pseudomonas flavescens]SDH40088.1 hypothetical protein SAMN05216588_104259 [Pseudomonas flavescens]
MNEQLLANIPAFGSQPAMVVDCPLALQPVVDAGIRSASDWYNDPHPRPLWRQLAYARAMYEPDGPRQAFESGFLNHLQQRLRHLQQEQPCSCCLEQGS